jgi:2',3'-cyclic-nucleotide 2'-phosphodiesterase (5'-nucleotidase family)
MKSGKKSLIILFSFLVLINLTLSENSNDEELIDISSGYTHVNPSDRTYFYIAILSTSDIHGHFYPDELEINGYNYTQGGFDYLAKYINILRQEFPERLLYLDAGDLFQGGTESILSNGEIMTESLNLMQCKAATFGDHEFDYSREFLEDKISKSTFPYLATNIYDSKKKTKQAFGENHLTSKTYIFNVTNSNLYKKQTKTDNSNTLPDQIKIGIIGLSKGMKLNEIKGEGYDDITFLSYRNELIGEAKRLREEEGCLAVLLLAHIGISCGTEKGMNLNMFTSKSEQELCDSEDELYKLVISLDANTIDGIITGHNHHQVHHWVSDIPIIASIDQGFYANILYIPFKWSAAKQIYELYKTKVQIEGPIPICDKIFTGTKKCDVVKPSKIEEYLPLVNYKFHGVKIEKDNTLDSIHEKYDEQFETYQEQICDIVGTEDILEISENGDFYIGNIITEIQRRITGADISLIGYDFMKTYWNPGKLPKYKISNLIPFKSNLCTFMMKGIDIKRMMNILQTSGVKYFPTSGIKQTISKNENGEYYLSDIKLFDGYKETELISEKEYVVSAIEYLIKDGGSYFNNILKWYKPQDLNCEYGDIRDIVEKYLKAQKVVDVTKYKDTKNPKIKFIE